MTMKGLSAGTMFRKTNCLSERKDAQMAFSMIAVIILLISGIAVTAISSNSLQSSSKENGTTKSDQMDKFSSQVEEDLSDTAYLVGTNVLNATYMSDPDSLQSNFQAGLASTIGSEYPMASGSCTARIDSYSIVIARTSSAGSDSADPLTAQTSNMISFFKVCGTAVLNVSCASGQTIENISIARTIYYPLPLLEGAWEDYCSLIKDDGSMLWKMVRYEVASLVQFRLYQDTYSLDSAWSSGALTEVDVQNAVVLSTMIIQRSVFTTYDHGLLDDLVFPSGSTSGIKYLQEAIESEGVVDPADIFLRMYGMGSINIGCLVAQSLYASADLIALRLLEYLRVADIINNIEEALQSGVFALNDLVSQVLGKDIESENARNWVKDKFDQIGVEENEYRYIWQDTSDWYVEIPDFHVEFINGTGGAEDVLLGGNEWLDISRFDILDSDLWKELRQDYQLATNDLIEAIRGMVKTIAAEISSKGSFGTTVLELNPFDGITAFDEMTVEVSEALGSNAGYFSESSSAWSMNESPDPMGSSIFDAIEEGRNEFYRYDKVMNEAYDEMSCELYLEAVTSYPDLRYGAYEQNIESIKNALMSESLGVSAQLNGLFEKDSSASLSLLSRGLRSPSDGSTSFWGELVSVLISEQILDSKTVESWIGDNVIEMLDDMKASNDIKGGPIEVSLCDHDSLFVTNSNGQKTGITIHLKTDLIQDLRVDIIDPVENEGGRINPNYHITDISDCSLSPFISCWNYIVNGDMTMDLAIWRDGDPSNVLQSFHDFMFLTTNTEIAVSSGWPIGLVNYEATNTLDQDALAIISGVWEGLKDSFMTIGGSVSDVYDLLMSFDSKSAEAMSVAIEKAGDLLEGSIETIQDFLRGMVLEGVCDAISTLTAGKNIPLVESSVLGSHVTIELNEKDPTVCGAKSIAKATLGYTMGKFKVSISCRIFKDSSKDYQFLMNASIRSSNMKIAMIIDPFMSSYSHIVEIKGSLGDEYIDICMPEVVRYKQVSFSLADLPGIGSVLSNIPLPIPGVKGQVNAGINIKLATDSTSGPVINEFELNPKGKDNGGEWVELFNPTNDVISLSGWTIETLHGKKTMDELGEVLMLPHSRFVYEFEGQALDNGNTGNLPDGESLVLRDATGKRVDSAPFVPDTKNDARTWQRAHDGSETWEFRTETKGAANSKTVSRLVSQDSISVSLQSIMTQTFELLEASGSSLSSLGQAMKVSMLNALTALMEDFAGAIIEIGLFVEISLVEESGTAGTNIRYSISADGSIIEESWSWLCSTIMDMIGKPLSALQVVGDYGLPKIICENAWFGASSGLNAKISPGFLGVKQSITCKVIFDLKMNIAATGMLIGEDVGKGKMTFGICLGDVISDSVPLMGLKAGQCMDIWLIKGTVIAG